ncbi:hypothetical protein RBB79_09440 [Tunturiibacter empetritectus]|uniref:Flagella basal body P-ring formation protein FlgA C-terminal domain-containing protein n=2 Tax=Tunturiibacter TaxID=3154218 RepID=A0A852VEV5_9BACT|nr:hypothetical protein [Edaphobacter lichenicola]NYF89771.1 hypothetical protein [Edaphobacter lichenicola]
MISIFSEFKTAGKSLFFLLHGISVANTVPAICYETPSVAIAAGTTSFSFPILESGGYRIARTQSDLILGQTWAMVIHCDHPDWPALAFPLQNLILSAQFRGHENAKNTLGSVVIHAGDVVRVCRQDLFSRLEVTGISEENGRLGEVIKVRLLRENTDDQSVSEQYSGIVRGPSNVEMKP